MISFSRHVKKTMIEKLLGIFGIEFEEDLTEEEQEAAPPLPIAVEEAPKHYLEIPQRHKRVPLNITVYEPLRYDECQYFADKLILGQVVIINYCSLPSDLARMMFNFMDGCIYALDGQKEKIGDSVYIYTPKNIGLDKSVAKCTCFKVDKFSN